MPKDVNVKIYKTATQKSIMDILSALHYHKENKNNELVYKGNIVFVINEYGSSKKTEKAYVSKVGAKVLFWSIMNHTFHGLFKNGFSEYGGSVTNGQVRSRIFSVKLDESSGKKRFIFQIDEGEGKREANGSIKMAKKEKTVQNYVAYEEAQKMAQEVYSYIFQEETLAMIKGNPLYTILPARNSQGQDEYDEDTYNINPSSHGEEEAYNAPAGLKEEPFNEPLPQQYLIKIGNWKGMAISTLEFAALEAIIAKINPDTPEKAELLEEAKKELERR